MKVRQQRKRGPRKGDGGRPRKALDHDDDRFVIAYAFWLRNRRLTPITHQLLKMLDLLFSKYKTATVEFKLEAFTFTLVNDAGKRSLGSDSEAGRSKLAAPGNNEFWKSRIITLERKIERYGVLTPMEAQWLTTSFIGLDLAAKGDPRAVWALASAEWHSLPLSALTRASEIADSMQAID
jgi:hypothetical protein